jgi:hypothetical protein
MQLSFMRTGVGLLLLLASSGCELIADFDRRKIPGQDVDTGMPMPEDDAGEDDAGASDAAASDDAGGE